MYDDDFRKTGRTTKQMMLLEIEYPNELPEQTKLDDFDEIDPRLDD